MGVTSSSAPALARRLRFGPLIVERALVWLVGFIPVVYLALSGGGYDIVARSEVGVLLWWVVVLGACAGLLPRRRMGVVVWVALGLFAAFLAWTWLAVGWTQSQERTLAEVARVATYLGMLVLGVTLVGPATTRSLLFGLACAVGLVALLAVLSRLVPTWFPADSAAKFYATSRLRYPFDYSDGVGEFAALGLPLLLFTATGARTLAGRIAGAAGLPVVVLCLALTVSRGGILAGVVGLIAFFALVDHRVPRLATAVVAAVASAVVMLELLHLSGVRDAFMHPAPASQRHAMLIVLGLACLAAAAGQALITLWSRRRAQPRRAISRRQARVVAGAILAVVLAVVLVGIASGTDNHLWQQFKQPNPPAAGNQYFRLLSVAGSHRYQYWQAAVAAYHTAPWKGIGPGTFEFYWAQHNSLSEFVRNAHSLYFETLAELGIVGLALIAGFVLFVIGAGSARALRPAAPDRSAIAAAVAAFAGFCAAAAFDWVWQIGVMPLIAMLLAAVAVNGDRERVMTGRRRFLPRAALGVVALVALWAILVPLALTVEVRSSQSAVLHGDFRRALADAGTAQSLEPAAASPRLQRALILEQLGDISGAGRAIDQAQTREPTDWRIWLVASRIATEANKPQLALADYRRARALNPTSPIFAS